MHIIVVCLLLRAMPLMTSVYTSPISFSLYPDYISTQESATPYRLYIVMLTASSILLSGCTATAAVQHKLCIYHCVLQHTLFFMRMRTRLRPAAARPPGNELLQHAGVVFRPLKSVLQQPTAKYFLWPTSHWLIAPSPTRPVLCLSIVSERRRN